MYFAQSHSLLCLINILNLHINSFSLLIIAFFKFPFKTVKAQRLDQPFIFNRSQQKINHLADILVSAASFHYNRKYYSGKKRERIEVIRIAVCEDEQILLEQLACDIKDILDKHSILYSLETYTNGNALLARGAFDILFLDIAMKPLNGLELAEKLRARGDESRLVFITAYQQYAIDAYDVQAYHYLLKPVDISKLEAVLMRLCSLLKGEYEHAVTIRQGTAVRRVPYEQILYLEVMNRKIYLHKDGESLPFYGKLNEIEPTLPDAFFRCHRSYIVNLDHVRHYKKDEIWLDNEEVVPLSRRRYQAFGLAFMYYLKERGDVF